MYYLFHADYRLLFIGVRTFNPLTLVLIPMYAPFFIFFLTNSLRVNTVLRFKARVNFKI